MFYHIDMIAHDTGFGSRLLSVPIQPVCAETGPLIYLKSKIPNMEFLKSDFIIFILFS